MTEVTGKKLNVAIQGVAGCFHDAAASAYFSPQGVEVLPVECETFHDLFDALERDRNMAGVVAIENTIAGPLIGNHDLLRRSRVEIFGEIRMRISHTLCALPGESIARLTEVRSHPMALMQCEEYLRSQPHLRISECFDTAGAARDIARGALSGQGAVCGEYAAKLYGLEILANGIETNKHNFTRFLVVAHPDNRLLHREERRHIDKASLVFSLPHKLGALSGVLAIFSFYELNLTKIQSLPIVGREWEYLFYIDLTFENYQRYRQAISAVRPLLSDLRVLGEYAESGRPTDCIDVKNAL